MVHEGVNKSASLRIIYALFDFICTGLVHMRKHFLTYPLKIVSVITQNGLLLFLLKNEKLKKNYNN